MSLSLFLEKGPFSQDFQTEVQQFIRKKKPKAALPWAAAAALNLALLLKNPPCRHRDVPGAQQTGLCALPHWELPKCPHSHCPGPGTPQFPHTRSPTAEFPLSSPNIGLEQRSKCRDTGGLEVVFPGCFGISSKKKPLRNKLEQLLCIKAGWKKLFY